MIFNIILNLVLIPKYSFIGSSVAFLICQVFLTVISVYVAQKISHYNLGSAVQIFLKTVFSAFIMGLAVYLLQEKLGLFYVVFIGAVVYILMLIILRGVSKQDYLEMKAAFLKQK